MDKLDIECSDHGAVTVLSVRGNVDSFTAEHLTQTLDAQVRDGRVRLVADLSGVSYTSSAGLRSLLAGVKGSRQSGGDLRLAGVQSQVERVLSLAGFTGILRMFDGVDAAIGSFGPGV